MEVVTHLRRKCSSCSLVRQRRVEKRRKQQRREEENTATRSEASRDT